MNKLIALVIFVAFLVTISMSLTLVDHQANHTKYTNNFLPSIHPAKYKTKEQFILDAAEDKLNFVRWGRQILDATEDVKNLNKKNPDGLQDRQGSMKWYQKIADAAEDWNNKRTASLDGIEDTNADRYWSDFKGDGKGKLVNLALKTAEKVPTLLS